MEEGAALAVSFLTTSFQAERRNSGQNSVINRQDHGEEEKEQEIHNGDAQYAQSQVPAPAKRGVGVNAPVIRREKNGAQKEQQGGDSLQP